MSDRRAPSCIPYVVASPLWTRAPARDANGSPYIDFMMIIPGLKNSDAMAIESCLVKLRNSLGQFENVVAYVDLNVKLNLLWISAKPVPGITRHIVQAIQQNIPGAKVVAGCRNVKPGQGGRRRRRRLSNDGFKALRPRFVCCPISSPSSQAVA